MSMDCIVGVYIRVGGHKQFQPKKTDTRRFEKRQNKNKKMTQQILLYALKSTSLKTLL